MKKNILLLGEMTQKHAVLFDELKKKEKINEVYIIPNNGKNSLVDYFKIGDNSINKNIIKTIIKEQYIIVKGKIHTENFIKPIIELNKFLEGDRLIHCGIFKNTKTKNTFILTDAACNLKLFNLDGDDLIGKAIQYATEVYLKCVQEKSEIYTSLLSAGGENNEKTNPDYYNWWNTHKFDYPEGQLRIEQLDVALNENIRYMKGISGPVSDIVIVKDINEGNAIWKSLTALSKDWICGGLLMGSKLPIVLNSREDTADSLKYSIELSFLL